MVFIKGLEQVRGCNIFCGGFEVQLVGEGSVFNNSNFRRLAVLTLRPGNTLFPLFAGVTLLALRPDITFLTLWSGDALFPLFTGVTFLTLRPDITFVAFRPLDALLAFFAGIAFLALRADITLVALRPGNTLLTLRSGGTFRPGNFPCSPCGP